MKSQKKPAGSILFVSLISLFFILNLSINRVWGQGQNFIVAGTGVSVCFGNNVAIPCPTNVPDPFYGQFQGVPLSYQDNGNGTITDLVTGLTWQSSPDANGNKNGIIEKADKLNWTQIQAQPAILNAAGYGGYNDWRVPTIKELYSLTYWNGTDPSGYTGSSTASLVPFIDTNYFHFAYGQLAYGERLIDSQYSSCNLYNETSWAGYTMLFGYNFADGRIKGYDLIMPGGGAKTFFLICVRGNSAYGLNRFRDNGDNTVTDSATGLMWTKNDSQLAMNWENALAWAQTKNEGNFCGHNDWRLPNAKELQTIVDYTRSPKSTNSAAIDPVFNCSQTTDEAGYLNWPWFWTSTTHQSFDGTTYGGANGIYVCFGSAFGWMQRPGNSYLSLVDVHGAGAQRSSPKSGTYLGDPLGVDSLGHTVYGRGPQGDVLRVNNFVRLVRGFSTTSVNENMNTPFRVYPNPVSDECLVTINKICGEVKIEILDLTGKRVKIFHCFNAVNVRIDLGDMRKGAYIMKICYDNNLSTIKIIKL